MARIRLSQRLLLLMLAAMLPLIAVLFYNLHILHVARQREVREEAFRSGELVALEIQRIFSGMENVLSTVAAAPSVQEFDATRCGAFLANTTARLPGVATIGVIGLDGVIKCRQTPAGIGISLADRPYFKEALRSDGLVVGEYTNSRVTGKALLPLAIALKDRAGKTAGVVAMSMDLNWLQQILERRKFDTGAALTLADRNGVILARHPFPERFVGTRIPDHYQYLVKAGTPGTLELTSQDGTRRLQAYFPASVSPHGIYVSTGVAVQNSFHSIRQAAILSVAATVFAIIASLFLSWQTNTYAIQKPVARILAVIDAWRNSHDDVRTGMPSHGDELDSIGTAVDGFLAELVVAREQRELLEAEMSHRIKNILAMVQAVAQQTFRRDAPVSDCLAIYSTRLGAIGEAFAALGREHRTAILKSLVKGATAPFEDPIHPQISMSGPDVQVGPRPGLAIAMTLHELGTNAVKYGALSRPEGRVLVDWRIESEDLVFRWEEQDGPAVLPPEKSGFGSQMMERVLASETGGVVRIDYASTGLKYEFRAPLARLAA
jgi:two-component sensor histidine kinase